jgi:hypothetical protein
MAEGRRGRGLTRRAYWINETRYGSETWQTLAGERQWGNCHTPDAAGMGHGDAFHEDDPSGGHDPCHETF